MKVYCRVCAHFSLGLIAGGGKDFYRCNAPDNLECVEEPGTWCDLPTKAELRKREAREINKNNDCSWFKPSSEQFYTAGNTVELEK